MSCLRPNLVKFYSYLPDTLYVITVFRMKIDELSWKKNHFIISSVTNGGVIYRHVYLIQDPTWVFICSFSFVTLINHKTQTSKEISALVRVLNIHLYMLSVNQFLSTV